MSSNRFDEEAAAWDSNPAVVASSKLFYKAICERLPGLPEGQHKRKRGIEIGCGTGLLSTQLAPHLRAYYGYDTSQGMIDVLNGKVAKLSNDTQLKAVKEMLVDPKSPSLDGHQFDIATSHLTLHHIPDDALQPTYQLLYDVLGSGGQVYLSDFEETAESELFHPKAKHYDVERHGQRRSDLEAGLKQAGFSDVKVEESFRMPKACEDGTTRDFPFLIATGRKQ